MDVVRQPTQGWIEVIVGCMFSGKSEELIRRLRRAQIARQRVQTFKPTIDNRFSAQDIVSHSEMRIESAVVASSRMLLDKVEPDTEVIGIDEGQFFDATLVGVADELANRGLRVIVAGLDQDYRGRPFEPMPQLMAVAEYVDKTLAVCMRCGAPANRSQRLVHKAGRVVVGGVMAFEMVAVLAQRYFGVPTRTPMVPADYSNTKELGRVLYTQYVYAFEIAAVILLVAIIAAIALTMRKRKDTRYQDPARQVSVKRDERIRVVSMPVEDRD